MLSSKNRVIDVAIGVLLTGDSDASAPLVPACSFVLTVAVAL